MTTLKLQSLRRIGRALLLAPLIVVGQSCTQLTETPHDALTPDNAFKTEAEVLAGVAGVYAGLRATEWVGYITLQDLTTDVSIVPTRGSDWYDNGRWLEIHRQTWTANSGSALDDMNGAWNNLFSGIAKANLMIDVVTKAGGTNSARDARRAPDAPRMVLLHADGHVRRRAAARDHDGAWGDVRAPRATRAVQLHRHGAHRVDRRSSHDLAARRLRPRDEGAARRDPREPVRERRRLQPQHGSQRDGVQLLHDRDQRRQNRMPGRHRRGQRRDQLRHLHAQSDLGEQLQHHQRQLA